MAEPTKAQLYEILEAEKLKLTDAEKVAAKQIKTIQSLEKQLTYSAEELEQLKSVEGVIICVNSLSVDDMKLLSHSARTTESGIAAFMAINYGISHN